MELPQAPLYVVVAIFMAVAAMTAAEVREKKSSLPRSHVNVMALLLLLGACVSLVHIAVVLVASNVSSEMSYWLLIELVAHCAVLVLLLLAVSIWYRMVALHKEEASAPPTSPRADS